MSQKGSQPSNTRKVTANLQISISSQDGQDGMFMKGLSLAKKNEFIKKRKKKSNTCFTNDRS